MSLEVEVFKNDNGKARVELSGRLDAGATKTLEGKLKEIDHAVHPVQVLDLSNLEYISSAGLRALFQARRDLTSHGGQLLLVKPQPQVRKVFEIVKALPVDEIFKSEQELDAYLEAIQQRIASGDGLSDS